MPTTLRPLEQAGPPPSPSPGLPGSAASPAKQPPAASAQPISGQQATAKPPPQLAPHWMAKQQRPPPRQEEHNAPPSPPGYPKGTYAVGTAVVGPTGDYINAKLLTTGMVTNVEPDPPAPTRPTPHAPEPTPPTENTEALKNVTPYERSHIKKVATRPDNPHPVNTPEYHCLYNKILRMIRKKQ